MPATHVADHLIELLDLGMTATAIATKAGMNVERIGLIVRGEQENVRRSNAEKILAVKYEPTYADNERQVAWPTRRRVGALNRLGWPTTTIAEEAGLSQSALQQFMTDGRTHVLAATALGVQVAYEKLASSTGPRPQTRLVARREGWPPPQAYRDDELDDLDELTTDRVKARWLKEGTSTPGELLFDLIEANDMTHEEFAHAVGIGRQTLASWLGDRTLPRSSHAKKMAKVLGVHRLPVKTSTTGPRPNNAGRGRVKVPRSAQGQPTRQGNDAQDDQDDAPGDVAARLAPPNEGRDAQNDQ